VVPLQIGAPDMAFPRINLASWWFYAVGGVIMLASFFAPGAAPRCPGWTSYPPLADFAPSGQTFWLFGMLCLIFSSLLGALNFITTIVQLRAPGPDLVPPAVLRLGSVHHRVPPAAGVSRRCRQRRCCRGWTASRTPAFSCRAGSVVSGERATVAGDGNVLMWQHLFWFLGHPEVYVLVLPAMGIIAEVITTNIRKPLWGYRLMVYALFVLGFLSFIVWAHHMFLTGMGTTISAFFQATTMIISIPSVIILSALILALYGGIDPFQHADALCSGVHADVRARRAHGPSVGPRGNGHSRCTTRTTSSATSTTWWRQGRSSRSSPASITGSRRSPDGS
jgi:cytochrome c oxidase subunit 1